MKILDTLLLLYLGMETRTDIRRKEISCVNWIAASLILMGCGVWIKGIRSVIGGMIPGILIMALAKATKGEIGMGDGCVLTVCGMALGFEQVCELFLLALFLLVPVSLWKIARYKVGRKYEIAFLPFLLTSYLVLLWIGE